MKIRNYLLLLPLLFIAGSVEAVCPICIVTVGVGVGLCRWLGVDDTISGLWIGAMLLALTFWTLIWLAKKGWNFKYDKIAVFLIYYLSVFLTLYFTDIIGHPLNRIFGIDKIIFGTVSGTIVFLFSVWFNDFLKSKNQGKVYFPYQKVAVPLAFLIIMSIIFYLIKC